MQLSADAVRRALKRSEMRSMTKVKKSLLKARHIRDRLVFARIQHHFLLSESKRLIFISSDKIT